MALRCPKSRILFQFIEDTSKGTFAVKTDWGFEVTKPTEDIKAPRWGIACVVGKDVNKVKPGEYILIEPLMWTMNFTHDGVKYWATSQEKVWASRETKPEGFV